MVKINYQELKFDHVVVFSKEDAIFACARENGSGKVRIFLSFGSNEGRIYTRNGRQESWELLGAEDAGNVKECILRVYANGVAVYNFNGSARLATGESVPLN